jgi:hypothetical protein
MSQECLFKDHAHVHDMPDCLWSILTEECHQEVGTSRYVEGQQD